MFSQETKMEYDVLTIGDITLTSRFILGSGKTAKYTPELIKSAVIFGGNASGKSNVIKAFQYMVNVVHLSAANLPLIFFQLPDISSAQV